MVPAPLPLQSGGAGALLGLFLILGLIVAVGWTYADAQDNSDHPAFLWALVVFLAPLLGLVLYVLLGRN